jgi:hypothetical protein
MIKIYTKKELESIQIIGFVTLVLGLLLGIVSLILIFYNLNKSLIFALIPSYLILISIGYMLTAKVRLVDDDSFVDVVNRVNYSNNNEAKEMLLNILNIRQEITKKEYSILKRMVFTTTINEKGDRKRKEKKNAIQSFMDNK